MSPRHDPRFMMHIRWSALTIWFASCALADKSGLSCLGREGKAVEWWYIYKFPILPDASSSELRDGMGYTYYDSSMKITSSSTLQPISKARLDSTTGSNPLKNTLDQIYDRESQRINQTSRAAFLMYNDELPCSEVPAATLLGLRLKASK